MLILIIGLIILSGIAMAVGVLHNRQIQKKIESGELKAGRECVPGNHRPLQGGDSLDDRCAARRDAHHGGTKQLYHRTLQLSGGQPDAAQADGPAGQTDVRKRPENHPYINPITQNHQDNGNQR